MEYTENKQTLPPDCFSKMSNKLIHLNNSSASFPDISKFFSLKANFFFDYKLTKSKE